MALDCMSENQEDNLHVIDDKRVCLVLKMQFKKFSLNHGKHLEGEV